MATPETSGAAAAPATLRRASGGASTTRAWLRALELTAPIAGNPDRILADIIEEQAALAPQSPALLSDHERMNYRELTERSRQYARWALRLGLGRNDVIGLMMESRPEYIAVWLGVTRTGCTVALLNTNLTGASLAHCINAVSPSHIIVSAGLLDRLASAAGRFAQPATIWVHGDEIRGYRALREEIDRYSPDALTDSEIAPRPGGAVTISDRALCIYTSGTTGLPKAANVSHGRILHWSHWFAGLLDTNPQDRMYDCLPLYHSVGGIVATGPLLARGGSIVLRRKFSAHEFWDDVVRWDCTLFQYIGELCRYLLRASEDRLGIRHRIRACCGNGLRPDIWETFQTRFGIPQILEFYAATESNVSLYNLDGRMGSIGRIPAHLAHREPVALVRLDDSGEPFRDAAGFCVRCEPNEPGEAIGRISRGSASSRFEGYTDADATARKQLQNVFAPGDTWFRTGDLLRRDEAGYYYFVDRLGDTFRWKGENVSTCEVADAICGFPGIAEAIVYGVSVPGTDGKPGMAALVADDGLDLAGFCEYLAEQLPAYAQPLFLRICKNIETTDTLKYAKTILAIEGYDPSAVTDPLFFNDYQAGAFVPLGTELHQRILSGGLRL